MSGGRKTGPGWDSPGGAVKRGAALAEKEADELERKLVELRALAERGLISPAQLAVWEARGGRELIELREAANTESRNTMGKNLERFLIEHPDKDRRSGRDLIAAMDADDRALREAMSAASTRTLDEVAVDLYEAFRRAGHSEREAFAMARGRDLSEAEMRRALDSQKVALSESSSPAAKVDARLEAAFADIGLSESAAKTATRGR